MWASYEDKKCYFWIIFFNLVATLYSNSISMSILQYLRILLFKMKCVKWEKKKRHEKKEKTHVISEPRLSHVSLANWRGTRRHHKKKWCFLSFSWILSQLKRNQETSQEKMMLSFFLFKKEKCLDFTTFLILSNNNGSNILAQV